MAASHPVLRDSLVALAVHHEGLETNNPDFLSWSVAKATKNIAWINQHYDTVPRNILLAYCIIATQLSGLMSRGTFLQSLRTQSTFVDGTGVDNRGLEPLCRRILSRQCQILDPLPLLREASLPVPPLGCTLTQCESLAQAQVSLENALNIVAAQVKSGAIADFPLLQEWLINFTSLRDHCHYPSWLTLKAAYGMSIIQIETMHSSDETIYDHYLDVYTEVADAYEGILASQSQGDEIQYRFNIDAGFLSLVGWAAKWCRHPPLRSRLILLLFQVRRIEGNHSSLTWAKAVEAIQSIEESGIHPPASSCADIPAHRRVRLHSATFYLKIRHIRVDILRHPYSGPCESVWLRLPPNNECVKFQEDDDFVNGANPLKPDWVMGPAYLAISGSDEPSDWYTMRSADFFFVIPKP